MTRPRTTDRAIVPLLRRLREALGLTVGEAGRAHGWSAATWHAEELRRERRISPALLDSLVRAAEKKRARALLETKMDPHWAKGGTGPACFVKGDSLDGDDVCICVGRRATPDDACVCKVDPSARVKPGQHPICVGCGAEVYDPGEKGGA